MMHLLVGALALSFLIFIHELGHYFMARRVGMKVEVFDENGNSIRGQKGELVCTAPFVSMPVSFWNDPDQKTGRESPDISFAAYASPTGFL